MIHAADSYVALLELVVAGSVVAWLLRRPLGRLMTFMGVR